MRLEWRGVVAAGLCFSGPFGCAFFQREQVASQPAISPPRPAAATEQPPPTLPMIGSAYQASVPQQPPAPPANMTVVRNAMPESTRTPLLPPARELTVHPVTQRDSASPRETMLVESSPAPAPLPDVPARPLNDPPLLAALRCYLSGRPAEALAWLEKYDQANQEILVGLMPLAVRLTQGSLDQADPQESGAFLAQLDSLMVPLRGKAPLQIAKICFCKRIEGFGNFDALPSNWAFRPGEPAVIYAEVQNFSSQVNGVQYVTRLDSVIEIRDDHDHTLWQDLSPRTLPDRSLSPRHDFYNQYNFQIPSNLLPGPYTLIIRVTDVPTGRSAVRSLDFRVSNMPPHNS